MSVGKWSGAEVRKTFVDFFAAKDHTFYPTSPVVLRKDPTLLFANAGMNQFKDIFLGTVDPNSDFGKLKRAVNSQLCIRAGGKHNDLEDVGRDTYHHTFFEMLGTWSFGDYFKKEAIEWAWELLTKVYGLEADRLYVTYFEGSEEAGLKPDTEARDLWKSLVPEDHIIKGNMKDNFWEMGDTGPCGPCAEIHYDRLGGRNAAHLVNQDDPMVLEIWNLVFMQFDRTPKGLKPLPSPHVDTGMGLERIVSILQSVTSNYDSDLWTPIFKEIQAVTKYKHAEDYKGDDMVQDAFVAYHVIADHIRCLVIALADGAMPDNVGRGFVLRRIIRRAVRFGVQFLGAEVGFFSQLVDCVVASLGHFFPHMAEPRRVQRTKAILLDEEKSFARTWAIGLKHFETARLAAVKAKSTEIASKDTFILHDRYGFPVDLTALIAEKAGFSVDLAAFKQEMKNNQSSGGRVAAAKTFLDTHQLDALQQRSIPTTVDTAKYTWENAQSKVLTMFHKPSEKFPDSVSSADNADDDEGCIGIIMETTNFYAEGGGQIYDTGSLVAKDGTFTVNRVHTFAGYVCHIGRMAEGVLKVGDVVDLSVNYERRLPIAANHTGTHQLNHSLRHVLYYGTENPICEVNQKGSLVTDDYMRFDFSWNDKLTLEQLEATEAHFNSVITQDAPVYSQLVPLELAMSINSLRCMFDEKYPDPVTVVSVGKSLDEVLKDPKNEEWKNYSLELCGGTHVKTFGDVQSVTIVGEDANTKGVRRMTVFTRQAAREAIAEGEAFSVDFDKLKGSFSKAELDEKNKAMSVLQKKINDSTIPLTQKLKLRAAIETEIKATNQLKKEVAAEKKAEAVEFGNKSGAEDTPALGVISTSAFGADRDALQTVSETYLAKRKEGGKVEDGVCIIGADEAKGKVLVMTTISDELAAKKVVSAVAWAKAICGKAGGKDNSAQGGITLDAVPDAIKVAKAEAEAMRGKM